VEQLGTVIRRSHKRQPGILAHTLHVRSDPAHKPAAILTEHKKGTIGWCGGCAKVNGLAAGLSPLVRMMPKQGFYRENSMVLALKLQNGLHGRAGRQLYDVSMRYKGRPELVSIVLWTEWCNIILFLDYQSLPSGRRMVPRRSPALRPRFCLILYLARTAVRAFPIRIRWKACMWRRRVGTFDSKPTDAEIGVGAHSRTPNVLLGNPFLVSATRRLGSRRLKK
jgi:hypothetical protein